FDVDKPDAGAAAKKKGRFGEGKGKAAPPTEEKSTRDEVKPAEKEQAKSKEEARPKEKEAEPAKADEAQEKEAARAETGRAKAAADATAPPKTQEDQPPTGPFVDIAAELEEDRAPKIKTGGNCLIKGARILTVTRRGTIERGNILIKGGKIAAIGEDL